MGNAVKIGPTPQNPNGSVQNPSRVVHLPLAEGEPVPKVRRLDMAATNKGLLTSTATILGVMVALCAIMRPVVSDGVQAVQEYSSYRTFKDTTSADIKGLRSDVDALKSGQVAWGQQLEAIKRQSTATTGLVGRIEHDLGPISAWAAHHR